MITYVADLLSIRNPVIKCMDQSECTAEFPGSELQRFLPEPSLKLWQRVNHRYQLELAGFVVDDCLCPIGGLGWCELHNSLLVTGR